MAMLLIAAPLLPVAAAAQEWRAYSYTKPDFSIQFPAAPTVQAGTAKNSTGVTLPVTRYTLRQDGVLYSLSVVNYSGTNDDALSTIAATEHTLKAASGKVIEAHGARINRVFGRELQLDGTDGSRSAIALIFFDRYLFMVQGQVFAPNVADQMGDALRFEKSLQFYDDNGGIFSWFLRPSEPRPPAVSEPIPAAPRPVAVEPRPVVSKPIEPKRALAPENTDAACAGKSSGDVVQIDTPSGRVAATCTLTLVARPNK
jgi:hypothetical protein